jgi:hypothetical protein
LPMTEVLCQHWSAARDQIRSFSDVSLNGCSGHKPPFARRTRLACERPIAGTRDWQHPRRMFSIGPLFFGLLWSVGLPVGVPPADVVNTIEHRIAQDRCVGSLAGWHRHYQFQIRGSKINRSFVSVAFVRAGHNGSPAGRFVTEPQLSGIDDSQHMLVHAEYEVATGRFRRWFCGWNFPPGSGG